MTSPHEPADCELAVCDRCDSYGDGDAAGTSRTALAQAAGRPAGAGATPVD